ncbi:MAG: hypothetical protein E7Z62_02950 [Thermoplasmata archaeon]|nr:hypothetical protein [Thermoplasmata archaeon]MBE6523894.1 hypothetical protein [Thermoplasmata archaeon]
MRSIESYDSRAEQLRLNSIEAHFTQAYRAGLAEQAALASHPVVKYVKTLPVEDATYPAIEYLIVAKQIGRPVQEVYSLVRRGITSFKDRQGNTVFFRRQHHNYIHWTMPGRDLDRPKVKGCGIIHAKTGGLVINACPNDPEHFAKAKRRHCWSMHCPECMNDTALRQGVELELRLKAYKMLMRKQGIDVGRIGHWVISPPQDLMKSWMQTKEDFSKVVKYIELSLQDIGALSGETIFHPWRMNNGKWELSPHFHNICYGWLDTDKFLKENPGWIIKKIHSHEGVHSIRHTAAYLYTHMGLGLADKDPEDVDWTEDILNYMIPGIKSPKARYSEQDYEEQFFGKGRMSGDIDIDWEDWTQQRLMAKLRARQWGGISKNKIRLIGYDRQYKIRVCKECGEIIRTYEGDDDTIGSYVRYIQDNPVLCLAHQFDLAQSSYLRYKDDLRSAKLTITDFAKFTPFAVSSLEFMPQNKDLVMGGPFAEPDEYFLSRQRAAYGEDSIDQTESSSFPA